MTLRTLFAAASLCVLSSPVLAQTDPRPVPAADLVWADLDPAGAPGVKIARVHGDLQKGPFGAFMKLPAGFAVPLHTHTHEMRLVMVSGTYLQAHDGKPEFRLGPASYLVQPGGNYRHTTGCAKGLDCVFYFQSDGNFDIQMIGTPAPGSN